MNEDANAIFAEEVERINAERGTNLTVEGILEGWGKKDTKALARSLGRGVLAAALGLLAGGTLWAGLDSPNASVGTSIFLLLVGALALIGFLFVLRREWHSIRIESREKSAKDEINRRVEARLSDGEGGRG